MKVKQKVTENDARRFKFNLYWSNLCIICSPSLSSRLPLFFFPSLRKVRRVLVVFSRVPNKRCAYQAEVTVGPVSDSTSLEGEPLQVIFLNTLTRHNLEILFYIQRPNLHSPIIKMTHKTTTTIISWLKFPVQQRT